MRLVMLVALAVGALVPAKAFTDVKADLTDGNFLTEAEIGGSAINFGLAAAEDGTLTRVDASDASANIVLSGRFHSNEHGWGNFSSTIAVEGPVKVSMGSCAWGGDVTIKDADGNTVGTFNTNNGACYHQNKTDNIVSTIYKGGATTLTISGGSYTPYIAVEAVDPSQLVDDINVTYSLGETNAEGVAPAAEKVEVGTKFVIPANFTAYLEGSTLTGWTDGTEVYAIGSEVTAPAADLNLTPVFTPNTVALDDRTDNTTIKWDFQRKNGAPLLSHQGDKFIYVAQAEVNGQTIDVKIDIDTTNGKVANGNWNDWAQCNGGTVITVPSCQGAVVSMEAYSTITTTTIDGMTDYAQGQTINYTIGGKNPTIDIVIGDGSYYRYVQVMLPPVEKSLAGTTFENQASEVAWAFNSSETFADEYTVTPEGTFSVVSVNTGDLEITGAATRTADNLADGIKFIKFRPSGETKAVEWFVKPVKGLSFTPTNISLWIQRFGTDAENGVNITARVEGGEPEQLGTYTAPRANHDKGKDKYGNNENWTNQVVIELTEAQQEALTSGEGFYLSATVGVGSAKEGGFSDVHIAGVLNGTVADVAKYTVTAEANPAEGGIVTIYPNSAEFEEGAEVRLTATKNFGYKFTGWTDAEGNIVSEKPVFTIEVNSNLVLTANFEPVATYSLNYAVEGGANLYMVQPTPAPTVIDGKNMYEDGTSVVLTASSNPILTFTNWSDGQTAGEITVNMVEDIDLTAHYTAVDYIAGWDFILAGNNGRPADFAAEDNDADVLVLRDAEGNTVGWLDKSGAAGGYEGRPGGVNWRTDGGLGHYYWQTKVNASAFTDIKVQTAMVYNYNAHTTYNVEYSLDGENFTTLGQINMPGVKNWTDGEFALPADANNQAEVYIRVIADMDSPIDGTQSNNDGATIGATYITGTAQLVDDGKAPAVVATVPAEGATNASANGKVVITFDEKVKLVEGTLATIGDRQFAAVATGKTVTVEYRGLAYGTAYRFVLPAGSVSDLTDNAIDKDIVVNFTVRTRPTIAKSLYDFVVPDDGTFKEAIAAANSRQDKTTRFRIFVKQGDYVLPVNENSTVDGAGGKQYKDSRTDLTASYVSIIGEGIDNTFITNDCPEPLVDGAYPCEGLRKVYTLHNSGTGTYIQDLRLINGMPDATGRGEAYEESGDKTILKNVGLWGYQDTYCSNNGRARYYFEGGIIRGRTDYICGKDDIFFNGVEFRNVGKGGYIAVPSTPKQMGWILRDCRITAENADENNGNYTLGRPWGSGTPIALWINTICEVVPSAIGWSEMSGGYPKRFAEYNSMTATGSLLDLSGRKNVFGDNHENNPVLTAEEAEFYTIANVLSGDDDWDPTEATEQASAPTNAKLAADYTLTWDNSDYVLLWAVCKDGKVVAFTTEPVFTADDLDATWSVRAANEMGGLGEATVAEKITSIIDTMNGVTVEETVYYNTQGMRVSANYSGIVIRVERMSDGSTRTAKIVK